MLQNLRTKIQSRLEEFWFDHFYPMPDWYWWLIHRLHPKHRYHVAKTNLKPGYYDPRLRIKAVVFEEIKNYYEKNDVSWDCEENGKEAEHPKAFKAMKEATEFWVKNRGFLLEETSTNFEHLNKLEEQARDHLKNIMEYIDFYWY